MGGWISVSGITGRPQVGDTNLGLITKEIGPNEMTGERKGDQNQTLGCLRPVEKEELGWGKIRSVDRVPEGEGRVSQEGGCAAFIACR